MAENMAQKIKTLRKKKELTLEQVADIVGVGKSTVRKWETGIIANMKRDKIAALAAALDTTPAFLMGWDEEDKPQNESRINKLYEATADLSDAEMLALDAFIAGLKANRKSD